MRFCFAFSTDCCSAVRSHALVRAMTALYRADWRRSLQYLLLQSCTKLVRFCGLTKSKKLARNERENCPKKLYSTLQTRFRFGTTLSPKGWAAHDYASQQPGDGPSPRLYSVVRGRCGQSRGILLREYILGEMFGAWSRVHCANMLLLKLHTVCAMSVD